MMIDTHCHLEKKDYDNLNEVIKKMDDNIIITSGVDKQTNIECINLSEKYKNVFCTIGIHPEYANESDEQLNEMLKHIENNINNKRVVGIGEIGLDFHYDGYNKEKQKKLFISQLELARKYNKTVVIHSRDSIAETYEILKQFKDLKKVIHCYSSSLEMALEFIKINCVFGIGGVLTFKNSHKLVDVVKNIDLKYFLLETDSPYLTPEPYRGTKNEPYNIIYVAKKISEIKNISLDSVLKQTTNNAVSEFDLTLNL